VLELVPGKRGASGFAEQEVANSSRFKSTQGEKAANNQRQAGALPRFDQTEFCKSSGLGELTALGPCLKKGLEVGFVDAFEAGAEATVDRLDKTAELGGLRCSSQETEDAALAAIEGTNLGKPIQALLNR
jgi:hypothetical protein